MSFVDGKLQKWLREAADDLTDQGPFTLLRLFHAIDGDPEGTLMQQYRLARGTLEQPEFAQQVWDLAEHEASTHQGAQQRFVILLYRTEESDYEARYPFVMRGRSTFRNQMGDDSTPPTEAGWQAQMLRHDSEAHRMMLLQSGAMAERQELELARKTAQIEALENRHMKTLLLQEELLDRKMERELRQGVEENKAKRMDQVAGMVMSFVPLLLGGLAGNKGSAAVSANARDMAVGNILKGLSEQEFFGIYNSLSPENQLLFSELYKSYREQDARDQKQKPQILQDKPAPEASN